MSCEILTEGTVQEKAQGATFNDRMYHKMLTADWPQHENSGFIFRVYFDLYLEQPLPNSIRCGHIVGNLRRRQS